ncbi:hypothetical protein N658DRAFT_177323 [Parathielavia hyrcaniae]|uniref:Uncharacterized protein n=1 Tax=Parathielavia hyrcaniae TaxID=113614 RepID=A0AAN6T4F5_9PEZI|nr:hypothetical protein N658DRAFT_177323 [Parathielavia hyrcaniae]
MAPYAPEWMTNLRDPRRPPPLAHLRSPHDLHRSRQLRDRDGDLRRPGDRDQDLARRDTDVEVRIVRDIIDDHPDHPININFNYGPVHIHQNCLCPNPSAHTCSVQHDTTTTTSRRRQGPTTYPYPPLLGPPPPPPPPAAPPPTHRGRPAGPSPALYRPRSPPRHAAAPNTCTITRIVVPSLESESSSSSTDLDEPPRRRGISRTRGTGGSPRPRRGILRTDRFTGGGGGGGGGVTVATTSSSSSAAASASTPSATRGGGQVRIGTCNRCLTRRRLVWGGYCADCEYYLVGSGGEESEEIVSVSSPGPVSPRVRARARSPGPGTGTGWRRGGGGPGAWSGGGNGNGGPVRVRYGSERSEDGGPGRRAMREGEILARERELLEREREREYQRAEREAVERDRLRRDRERDAIRNGFRRGVRWESNVEVRDGGGDRRCYPRTAERVYFSDSEGESAW